MTVELRLIADLGLVGKPNAGKSSLLGRLTAAHPRVGSYPFTTKVPNLGVLQLEDRHLIIADIPGLIEGAAQGAGLGDQFLKHIARTRFLAWVIDLGEPEPEKTVAMLAHELSAYSAVLAKKPRLLIGNKADLPGAEMHLRELAAAFPGESVLTVSALTGLGIRQLAGTLLEAAHGQESRKVN